MLQVFASKYGLAIERDVITGMRGAIYEHGADALAVMFAAPQRSRTRQWKSYRTKCISAGMTLLQDGKAEGAFSFDPSNPVQACLAIRVIRAHRRKQSNGCVAALLGAGVRTNSNSGDV